MIHTGGRWDPNEPPCYFIAGDIRSLVEAIKVHCDHLLLAINDLHGAEDLELVNMFCRRGKRVFIDSGVFNLANSHARAHQIPMDQALQLAPESIDGFADLFERYVQLMQTIGADCWGYVELDQGGRDNKIRTRARLEALGLRPIPVYHPLNDGWDYFDELASTYDRICFGNVVQADRATRIRLLATAFERRRKYPGLWIHMLGMTPNQWLNAYPINSCDSSTWLRLVRWPAAHRAHVALQPFTGLSRDYTYDFAADADAPSGHKKARQLGAYDAHMLMENWRACAVTDYGRLA
jgi:hypothetical protein